MTFDVGVVAGEPRPGLAQQQALVHVLDVPGPLRFRLDRGLDALDAALQDLPEEHGGPVDRRLDAARKVRRQRRALRARQHEEIGKSRRLQAEVVDRPVAPLVAQVLAVGADEVDVVEGAGHGVEAGGVDDQVELVVALRGADAGGRDALDRRVADADQVHVVAVVGLVVARFHRHALHAETVVLGDQLLGELRVLHALADLVGDEGRELGVRLLVHQHVAEVAQPDAEAGRRVELLPEGQPLLARHLGHAAPVGPVDEAARSAVALLEDLLVAGLDLGHLRLGDRRVVQRGAPVGAALEDGEIAHLVGNLGDQLHAGGAGADDGHPLAGQLDRLLRPVVGVERRPAEAVHPRQPWHGGRRQQTDGGQEEAAGQRATTGQLDRPDAVLVVEDRALDRTAELDVRAQLELVDHVVHVAQRLRLRGEVLRPAPLVEQFPGERVAVGVALGVEAAARIAVPVPGAADIACAFDHRHVGTDLEQLVQLVQAAHAGADDDEIMLGRLAAPCSGPQIVDQKTSPCPARRRMSRV